MIKVTELETSGWKAAVRGLRNPKESWGKSDSGFVNGVYVIGQNDLKLMRTLIKSGSCERKFLRMIDVVCDIEAPLYWWKEFDTYKVGTVANSCSTMHTITEHPITMDLFSHDRLTEDAEGLMEQYIAIIEFYRQLYLDKGDVKFWNNVIQMLPSSWMQKRTVKFNYEHVLQWWIWRKNHKLSEWVELVEFLIKNLPNAAELMLNLNLNDSK